MTPDHPPPVRTGIKITIIPADGSAPVERELPPLTPDNINTDLAEILGLKPGDRFRVGK